MTKPILNAKGERKIRRGQKPPKERKVAAKHPLLKGREINVWHEDLVGRVPNYPATLEAYEKMRAHAAALGRTNKGKPGRIGVPDGWGGKARRLKREQIIEAAKVEAKEIVMELNKQGLLEGEDARGDEAIEWAVAIIRAKGVDGKSAYTMRDQMEAAKLVAMYCKAKPVARTQTKVEAAEDFLALLASKP